MKRAYGFTLAEVLITLGIIGVVVAMTLPTLMTNYRKTVIETRLQKFYSTMNQSIAMAVADYGDKTEWETYEKLFEKDEEGKNKPIENTEYFNKYFAPYLLKAEIRHAPAGLTVVYFADGSAATFSAASIKFYPFAKDFKEMQKDKTTNELKNNMEDSGIKYFTFFFNPTGKTPDNKFHYDKGVEPYMFNWDGTREKLFNDSEIGCKEKVSNERAYCTELIRMNGWKIPKDYPLKF